MIAWMIDPRTAYTIRGYFTLFLLAFKFFDSPPTFVVIRPSLYSSFIIFHTFHKRNTPYGSWTQRDGRLHDTNIERTICRFSKPGIFALAAAVPVRIIYLFSVSYTHLTLPTILLV